MTKLTIEYLSCYLPYGVKIKDNETGKIFTLVELSIGVNNMMYIGGRRKAEDGFYRRKGSENRYEKTTMLPILRPLSDLTGTDIVECLSYGIGDAAKNLQEGFVPQWKFMQLVRNHFDVFNLIPSGLAISIHDVEGEVY